MLHAKGPRIPKPYIWQRTLYFQMSFPCSRSICRWFFLFFFLTFCRAGDSSRCPPPWGAGGFGGLGGAATGERGTRREPLRGSGSSLANSLEAAAFWSWETFAPWSWRWGHEAWEHRKGCGSSCGTGGPGRVRLPRAPLAAPRPAPSPSQAVKWRLLPTGERKLLLEASLLSFFPVTPLRFLPLTPLSFCPSHLWAFAAVAGHLLPCLGGRCHLTLEGDRRVVRVLQGRGPQLARCPSTGQGLPVPHQAWALRDPPELPAGHRWGWRGTTRTQQSSLFSRHLTDHRNYILQVPVFTAK